MNTPKTQPSKTKGYAVGCEPERPYSRLQVALLRLLGLVLGRTLV
jgi:hypothetical protein